jgi:2-methylisocitrate lyase-like PEP mutase family enzyme
LQAFEAVGADCLYAPMTRSADDLAKITTAVKAPVNALIAGKYTQLDRDAYAKMNVARLSLGSSLARITHRALYDAAKEMLQNGGFTLLGNSIGGDKVDALLTKD